ncbi:40S ribosomal S15a-1, partial [Olea europaea subsp. europaea]
GITRNLSQQRHIFIKEFECTWPPRKNVVACAGVCRSWREIMKEIVRNLEVSSKLTFPSSLKQDTSESLRTSIITDLEKMCLNKCEIIKPHFDIGIQEIEGWTASLLSSRQFGYILLITSTDVMDHDDVRRKNVGQKVQSLCTLVSNVSYSYLNLHGTLKN